jgi:large subunit ribosomal protein L15
MLNRLNLNRMVKLSSYAGFMPRPFLKICGYYIHTADNSNFQTHNLFEPITSFNLRDNPGAKKERIRVGRGPGSGKGKTSGRGHKGYLAHVGNINRHYEGGQTPITRSLPKFGFRRPKKVREDYDYVNLGQIIYLVLKGRLDTSKTITIKDLAWSGAVSNPKKGVKVLSRGSEKLNDIPPLNLEISSASQRAIDEIKKNGGSVSSVYRTPLTLRYHIKPWKFIRQPLDPVPPFKKTVRLMHLEEKGIT